MRDMTDDEIRDEGYAKLRKSKAKAYVRINTTMGMLNLELHCDMAPRASHNFLMLCEKGYYDGTIFHRCIKNFMIQARGRQTSDMRVSIYQGCAR